MMCCDVSTLLKFVRYDIIVHFVYYIVIYYVVSGMLNCSVIYTPSYVTQN